MKTTLLPVVALSIGLCATASRAAAPQPVSIVPGYKCMTLNLTVDQAMDPSVHTPFYIAPSTTSQIVGYAGLQVAVRDPAHEVNGFTEALFTDGTKAWIKSNMLRQYHSLGDPTARCVPAKLSNGRVGFDYPHQK